jgi:hypothetical protein
MTLTVTVHDHVLDDVTVALRSHTAIPSVQITAILMSRRVRPAVRGWTGTPNQKSTPQHPPTPNVVIRSRQHRGKAVDANPNRPGRRCIALGCAGRALVGDRPATTTTFVQKLRQLSEPHCLGELAPAVWENPLTAERTGCGRDQLPQSSFSAA